MSYNSFISENYWLLRCQYKQSVIIYIYIYINRLAVSPNKGSIVTHFNLYLMN